MKIYEIHVSLKILGKNNCKKKKIKILFLNVFVSCLPLFLEYKFLSSPSFDLYVQYLSFSNSADLPAVFLISSRFSPFHLLLFKFKELSLEKWNQVMRPHKTPRSAESDLLVINP